MIWEGLPFLCLLTAASRQSRANGRVKTTVADGLGQVKSLGVCDSLRRNPGRGLRTHLAGGKARPEQGALPLPGPGAEVCKPLEPAEVALSDLSSRPTLLGTEPAPCSLPSRQNLPGQGGATQSSRWAPGGLPQRLHLGGEPQGKATPTWV